ncbi:MAG: phosphoribosylformimino-5-aminoimidazole carboxamide ribotide isomerase [Lachnospiraceae bacterium]|nr:phosphoribosylformimino-5-aminoimidazole carboxamide ribotide isomerase [Lachnospiraceae bacterium]
MKFRPCIDIHNGLVKQIVGGSLSEREDPAGKSVDNYVSDKGAAYYAKLYRSYGLTGGHVILLNKAGTPEYEADKKEAFEAFAAYPGGLQAGGGINPDNAGEFLERGASHVIVTSYLFENGELSDKRLSAMRDAASREHLVIDLSCRIKDGVYYVVTDRWQRFTREVVDEELFLRLSEYSGEFLIHAADVEGKKAGVDRILIGKLSGIPCTITYAGGISDLRDIELIREAGQGRLDFTVGSALDLFGGTVSFKEVIDAAADDC